MTGTVPSIALPRGEAIPQLGFGVWQVPPGDTEEVVLTALGAGYRHIDTAAMYGNEGGVGQAVRASGLDRGEVFVTTKLNNDAHGRDEARRALHTSLEHLQMEHVDLYLIHWPIPARDRYVETWQTLIELREEGLARSIGTSNFQQSHLERLVRETGVAPAVDQVELHPSFQQRGLRRELADLGIVTEAWSPLGQGSALGDPVIGQIAKETGRTPGQVIIRWHLQLGNVVIPKSVTPERIRENFDVFGFELDDAQMERIAGLDDGQRIGPDPDRWPRS